MFNKICDKISHVQRYECATIININNKNICCDKCMTDEIEWLNSQGIQTTGCCCGNHQLIKDMQYPEPEGQWAYINIKDENIDKMLKLGYTYWVNKFGVKCFRPKTNIIKEI